VRRTTEVNGKPRIGRGHADHRVAHDALLRQGLGLLVRTETTVNSAAGAVAVVAEPGDFRKWTLMGRSRALEGHGPEGPGPFEKVEHNVAIGGAAFALPARRSALIKKRPSSRSPESLVRRGGAFALMVRPL